MKGFYEIIQGDVTNPIGEGIKIIPHIISDLGVCGAGVAKAIVKKWPQVKKDIREAKKESDWGLGRIIESYCKDSCEQEVIKIISMVSQKGLRTKENLCPIKYEALVECMIKIRLISHHLSSLERVYGGILWNSDKTHSIHCPKFGSSLAGGDWKFIEILIKEIWIDNGIDVVVYEYENKGKVKPSAYFPEDNIYV